jgi:hypothetical protein
MFFTALLTVATVWRQPRCPPIVRRMKKMWNIRTVEYRSALEKKEILLFFDNLDGPRKH